ncbi:YjcQ family protein [Bacillus atrophaeus]|uniref:YjcQ family protein n=1 Tax=Bacillus atrophaeus TaxID=1452 RepID=UPI002280AA2F|nr:YjcQ family protein [Bacillus atrophaeus]MCY8517924.1 YjcQ family protein [Bacillus atrophaeus]MCY8807546.1 YjcQ family protein [Bacillus atrophaeus]
MDKEKLRYAIAKEISEGNTAFSEMDFGVTEEQFDGAVNFLSREGYLIGIKALEDRPDLLAPELTEKGENYLKENGTWSKAYKTIKEVRDWLK